MGGLVGVHGRRLGRSGIVALVWPGITALVLLYIIAFYAIMFGIFGIVGAFKMKALPGSSWGGWLLAASVLAVIFGIILLIAPGEGIISLIWLLVGTQSCSASS